MSLIKLAGISTPASSSNDSIISETSSDDAPKFVNGTSPPIDCVRITNSVFWDSQAAISESDAPLATKL